MALEMNDCSWSGRRGILVPCNNLKRNSKENECLIKCWLPVEQAGTLCKHAIKHVVAAQGAVSLMARSVPAGLYWSWSITCQSGVSALLAGREVWGGQNGGREGGVSTWG